MTAVISKHEALQKEVRRLRLLEKECWLNDKAWVKWCDSKVLEQNEYLRVELNATIASHQKRNAELAVLEDQNERLANALKGCVEWMEAWRSMTMADARGDHENGMQRCNSAAFVERFKHARAMLAELEEK